MPRAVTPVQVPECGTCPWRKVCAHELAASDHVSLLPRTTWETFVHHRRHDLVSRRDMAQLDWPTAWVMQGTQPSDTSYDLSTLHAAAAGFAADSAIADVVGKRSRTLLGRLGDVGIRTAGDVTRLDRRTAALPPKGAGHFPTLIDQARAAVSSRPHRARGCTEIEVPRADVEIDLDMENTADGVYLWGTLTTLRSAAAVGVIPDGYEPLIDWDDPTGTTPGAEARLLLRLQTWLDERQSLARGHGLTLRIYCWSGAEAAQIRRVVRSAPSGYPAMDGALTPTWADELLSSPLWVDLFEVFRTQVVTGGGAGLKLIAPLAGFAWRDEDPGGDQSQLWYRMALDDPDAEVRDAMRQRLLDYNEDDVNATLAIREWLDRDGSTFPPIDDWT
jgi:predicted RecB family nuclease